MEENITLSEENSGGNEITSADAVQETQKEPLAPEKSSSEQFEELIRGKYKGEFQKRVQGIIDARFRKDKEAAERERAEAETTRIYDGLLRESAELKEHYPDFDLRDSLRDERFKALISRGGIDLKTAYEICHKEEIISSAMAEAAKRAREKTVEDLLSLKSRPSDSISASGSGSSTDIRSLTKRERELLCRRAAAGERITLR
ncbi:MAG: hypothetical protein J6K88_02470 [Oscillospiraceae bacterium]|nr:hypothetical protein [Oscillospiraceae bacterium]